MDKKTYTLLTCEDIVSGLVVLAITDDFLSDVGNLVAINGFIYKVTGCEEYVDSSLIEMISKVTTVQRCDKIYHLYWSRQEAEEQENQEDQDE